MNRADRRRQQRETQKISKIINKFNPNQAELLESLWISYQRVVNASLFEHGFDYNKVESIFNIADELRSEEVIKAEKLNEELIRSGNIEMAKKKIEDSIINGIKLSIGAGKTRKETIDEMLFKFPNMSKAMIINAYAQVKEELKEQEDSDIEEALEYVFSDEEEKEMSDKKEAIKTDATVTGATAMAANLSAQEKSKLKIKSMVVEGENGTYKVCENGVELSNGGLTMFFENPEQLYNFTEEFRQVFSMI